MLSPSSKISNHIGYVPIKLQITIQQQYVSVRMKRKHFSSFAFRVRMTQDSLGYAHMAKLANSNIHVVTNERLVTQSIILPAPSN